MKKHFWKISALACAAIVSACAVTASAAGVADSSRYGKCFTESGEECPTITAEEFETLCKQKEAEYRADPKHTVAPYMIETTESGLTVFEEALLAGDYSLGCGIVECDSDHVHLSSNYSEDYRLKEIDKSGTRFALTESENASYPLWTGRFICDKNLSTYKWYSISPEFFEISGDGRKITMRANDNVWSLYKKVSVRLTYLKDNNIRYTNASINSVTEQEITVNGETADGELVEIAAFGYLYDGSTESAGFREVAMVHILSQCYAPIAIENNEPYAHLIDEYTPI
ncbi:MAG: hypothetical protein HDT42_08505 [Ruminococcaceae bacterium]|nr:hypothetical protein [Oscillospiraceae bacterium]